MRRYFLDQLLHVLRMGARYEHYRWWLLDGDLEIVSDGRVAGASLLAALADLSRQIDRLGDGRHPDVAQVAGAVARRDVHASAEGNGQMCIVAADAGPVVKGLQRCPRHARVLIAEGDMSMDIVADSLNSAPSRWRLPEEIPRRLGKPIGLAVPASEQEEQRFLG